MSGTEKLGLCIFIFGVAVWINPDYPFLLSYIVMLVGWLIFVLSGKKDKQ
jgi:hypothetical protein